MNPRRNLTALRFVAFAGSMVLLCAVALLAGQIGNWQGVDRTGESAPTSTYDDRTVSWTFTRDSEVTISSTPTSEQASPNSSADWINVLLIVVACAALALVVLWVVNFLRSVRRLTTDDDRRQRPPAKSSLAPIPPPPPEVARESGRDFDPRAAADAIVSCWLWVEKAAQHGVFARHPQDTPTEFLGRFRDLTDPDAPADVQQLRAAELLDRSAATPDMVRSAVDELLPLYQQARFDHVALTADAAVRAREAAHVLCAVAGIAVANDEQLANDPQLASGAPATGGWRQ